MASRIRVRRSSGPSVSTATAKVVPGEMLADTTAGTVFLAKDDGSVVEMAMDADVVKLTGGQTIAGAKTFSSPVSITSNAASTSTTTGALKVDGGVGIVGALNVGGKINSSEDIVTSKNIYLGTFTTPPPDPPVGVDGVIRMQGNLIVNGASAFNSTTASTDPTTGSVTFGGGIGVAGAVHAGADSYFNGIRIGKVAGTNNTVIGDAAGASLATGGNSSVLVGYQAGDAITTGDNHVAVGAGALSAATTNSNAVAVGYNALLWSTAADVVAIGSEALDVNTLGTANVAVGRSALGAATTAIATVTTTVAGTGGTDGAKTGIQLERDSGGTMVVYPTVDLTVTSGAVTGTVTVATGGSGSTSNTAGGIIFRANAAGIALGVPADWRCQLQTVATAASNTALGHQAGLSLTSATQCTLIGNQCGDAITNGANCTLIGSSAGGALTSSQNVIAIGVSALARASTTASQAIVVGTLSCFNMTTATNTIAIGNQAARFFGTGSVDATDGLTSANSCIYIGSSTRANANTMTNEIVVGTTATGDGSNTVSIGTTATTQSRLRGATFLSTGANGQSTQLGQSTTLLSGLTGATVTATNLIPANSILLGVTARVTTAITGATTFDIGDGTTANRFGDDVAIALNTTSQNCIAPALIAAATNVVLTANGSNFTGGAVRLTAHFMTLVAPTS